MLGAGEEAVGERVERAITLAFRFCCQLLDSGRIASLPWWLAVGVEDFFVVTYVVAVATLEAVEDDGGDHRENT